jgi:hypothetical protein
MYSDLQLPSYDTVGGALNLSCPTGINFIKCCPNDWLKSIESTARHISNKPENVVLEYDKAKNIKFFVEDAKSRDCLVKAIEICFHQFLK